jgi:hypothetical protein
MAAAAIPAAIGVGGSLIGGGKASKSASKAQAASEASQLRLAELQNQWGRDNAALANSENLKNYGTANETNWANALRENQLGRETGAWANDLNWQNADRVNANNLGIANQNQSFQDYATAQNRPEQIGVGGGSVRWTTDANGNPVQTSSLGAGSQGLYDQAQGVQGQMLGGLEGGFGVDNSVMSAMRGLQAPGLQQSRDAENARLAAMGLSTGSGTAWGNAQDTLNRASSTADLQAILAGNTAWQQSQANMRSNLGAAGQTATGQINDFRNSMPGFANQQAVAQNQQQGISGVTTPQTTMTDPQMTSYGNVAAPNLGNVAQNAQNAGNAASQATGSSWADASKGIGQVAGSAWNYFNQPATNYTSYAQNGGSVAPPGYYP